MIPEAGGFWVTPPPFGNLEVAEDGGDVESLPTVLWPPVSQGPAAQAEGTRVFVGAQGSSCL